MSWKDLLIRPGTDEVASETPAPQSQPRPTAAAPITITGLMDRALPSTPRSATAASTSGPSPRALELAQKARLTVPATNAVVKLIEMMGTLESILPDVTVRRQAALAALAKQGVTAETVEQGIDEARDAVNGALNSVLDQIKHKSSTDLGRLRNEATSFRDQAGAIDRQIADLQSQKATLLGQAGERDTESSSLETQLAELTEDVEEARVIAANSFGN